MKSNGLSKVITLGVPLVISIAGVVLAWCVTRSQLPALFMEVGRGTLPDGFEVKASKKGDYTLWLYSRGQWGNQWIKGPGELPPGHRVYLFDRASGEEIHLRKGVRAERFRDEEHSVSLGVFSIDSMGQMVEVRGAGVKMEILLSVTPSSSRQSLRFVLTLAVIVLGAQALAVVVFVYLRKRWERRQKG